MKTLAALLALCSALAAGTLTGKFALPTSGQPVANGTLSLALSQAAVVPGSFAIVPATVSCYTSTDGSVVGLANPIPAPSVTATPGTGALAAGTYFVELTYIGDSGETLGSAEASAVLSATGELSIAMPSLQPAGATSLGVYIGTSSGAETKQATIALPATQAYTQSTALTAGAAVPSSNTTTCSVEFNDATIPADTYYTATLSDSGGNALPGYPQNWYLSGSTVDVSNLEPLRSNPALRFPSPILANPATSASQSLNSPLYLNGWPLTGSSNVGPGYVGGFYSGTLPVPVAAIGSWTPNQPVIVRRLSLFAATAGSGGTNGTQVELTSSQGTCTFSGLLAGATVSGSVAAPGSGCTLAAGVTVTVEVAADDHATRPGNVTYTLETTAQ